MCLYVNTLRPEVTLRIWDMFFNEGSKVLFRVAAALFKLRESHLIKVKDSADLFTALRNIGEHVVDPDILIAAAYNKHVPLHRSFFKSRNSHDLNLLSVSDLKQPALNPRLKTCGLNGNVPRELIGIGLAHIGPTAIGDKIIKSGITQFSREDMLNLTNENTSSGKIFFDCLDTDNLKKRTTFRKHQRRKSFTFYRADIVLWRCSFRPALEERHLTMEAARKKWFKLDSEAKIGNILPENENGDSSIPSLSPIILNKHF
jgi:hypothetical protein